jgi:hypothetical protein
MLRCKLRLALLRTFYYSGELIGHLCEPGRRPCLMR